jgi:hypothetical protein
MGFWFENQMGLSTQLPHFIFEDRCLHIHYIFNEVGPRASLGVVAKRKILPRE